MIIRYSANGLPGKLPLPSSYIDSRSPEELAELAAAAHWWDHPEDTPTFVTVVHMRDVDGHDLGLFEVRCEQRPIFSASPLRQA
ncbi:hypothetical protein [Pseudomonas fluorescens]|uniref:hypothetical protein n=1 Tax=Pseudomonas fluorescens TaxID=294 RepID=UPI001BEAFAEE|nr:hypothetical protein [Pseudomonas fluorescens]MBT2375803.1 hypothetical protein [Pseudomonas fluorescens]